ncbi:MAG: L,D-transpeptidase [Thermoleophilaceae bacterium]
MAVAACLVAAIVVVVETGVGHPPADATLGPDGVSSGAVGQAVHPPGDVPRPRLELDAPDDAYPVVWVRDGHRVEVRTEPGGGRLVERAGKRTEFGSPTVFGVIRDEGRWAAVSTPKVANGELGWVRLDPRRLRAGWVRTSIVIDLSERRAELRKGDRSMRSFAVTVGASGSDTPTGRYAVTDTFRGDLNPAYGCCAVAISANQPHLPSGWLGGSRIAIHGTSGPLGLAASNGCVRAADEDVSALVDRAYLGTPVFIRG